jgi:protein-tyrosine phosphatase
MNLDQVLPNVFVGSHPATTADIDQLKHEFGITAVLTIQTDEDLAYLRVDWPCLAAHYRAAGIEIRRVPVRDFDREDLRRNLPQCVAALDELLRAGHTVYVHCTAGMGRAPTTVIAYLAWKQDWQLEKAVEHVGGCRLCVPNVQAIRMATEQDGSLS